MAPQAENLFLGMELDLPDIAGIAVKLGGRRCFGESHGCHSLWLSSASPACSLWEHGPCPEPPVWVFVLLAQGTERLPVLRQWLWDACASRPGCHCRAAACRLQA